jgi:hypothetical protein
MNPKNEISMIDTQIAIELGWANYYGHFNDSGGACIHLGSAKTLFGRKQELILKMEAQEREDAVNEEYKKTSKY